MPNLGGYNITFVSAVCNPNGTQTWTYNITIPIPTTPPRIQHWILVLCPDPEHIVSSTGSTATGVNNIIVGAGPPCFVGVPNTIRWMYTANPLDNEVIGNYFFTLQGCFKQTQVDVAVQTGTCEYGTITGPSCEPLPPPPPRGVPFSEDEKITAIFRKNKK